MGGHIDIYIEGHGKNLMSSAIKRMWNYLN
jgi:hypothetical protein